MNKKILLMLLILGMVAGMSVAQRGDEPPSGDKPDARSASGIPQSINFQGVLRDSDGALVSGKSITVILLDKDNVGIAGTSVSGTTDTNGFVNVVIDLPDTFNYDLLNDQIYARVSTVDDGGKTITLEPDQPFYSVPYALNSLNAEMLGGKTYQEVIDEASAGAAGGEFVLKAGDTMTGSLRVDVANSDRAIIGTNSRTSGNRMGVVGLQGAGLSNPSFAAAVAGVYGEAGSGGAGVFGKGAEAGVSGYSDSKYGVYGVGPNIDGMGGVVGSTLASPDFPNGSFGVFGTSDDYGVYGRSTTGYSGFFTGGQGVKIDGPLEVSNVVKVGSGMFSSRLLEELPTNIQNPSGGVVYAFKKGARGQVDADNYGILGYWSAEPGVGSYGGYFKGRVKIDGPLDVVGGPITLDGVEIGAAEAAGVPDPLTLYQELNVHKGATAGETLNYNVYDPVQDNYWGVIPSVLGYNKAPKAIQSALGTITRNTVGVRGYSVDGFGVLGESENSTGIYGQSTSGIGIYGKGATTGGSFESTSMNGTAVYGRSSGSGSVGLRGRGTFGVYGMGSQNYGGVIGKTTNLTDDTSTNVTGFGVYGEGKNYGVYGKGATAGGSFESTGGSGVRGIGAAYGVYGKGGSGGVVGLTDDAQSPVVINFGLFGGSNTGSGVQAYSSSGYGIWADSGGKAAIFAKGNATGGKGGIIGTTRSETSVGLPDAMDFGVFGESENGLGVEGRTSSRSILGYGFRSGVVGYSTASYNTISGHGSPGVYGNSSSGYGGLFEGAKGGVCVKDILVLTPRSTIPSMPGGPPTEGSICLDTSGNLWVYIGTKWKKIRYSSEREHIPGVAWE